MKALPSRRATRPRKAFGRRVQLIVEVDSRRAREQPETDARTVPRMVWGRVNLTREVERGVDGEGVGGAGILGEGVAVEFVLDTILGRAWCG